MIIDLAAVAILALLIIKGFRSGFVPSLFAVTGYLIGAIAGLVAAREVTDQWDGFLSTVGLHLLLIFVGAKLGSAILRYLGRAIRRIIGPFKFLDSIFGALLGLFRGAIIVFLGVSLLNFFPQAQVKREMKESRAEKYLEESAPQVLEDAFTKLQEIVKRI